jgi:hypothetical protein
VDKALILYDYKLQKSIDVESKNGKSKKNLDNSLN